MVAAVAAVPLFLSSVGSASLALQASERCPRDTGASVPLQLDATGVEAPPDDPFSAVSDRLGPSNRWLSGQREALRSEESRGGKACVSPCRSRWMAYH